MSSVTHDPTIIDYIEGLLGTEIDLTWRDVPRTRFQASLCPCGFCTGVALRVKPHACGSCGCGDLGN